MVVPTGRLATPRAVTAVGLAAAALGLRLVRGTGWCFSRLCPSGPEKGYAVVGQGGVR